MEGINTFLRHANDSKLAAKFSSLLKNKRIRLFTATSEVLGGGIKTRAGGKIWYRGNQVIIGIASDLRNVDEVVAAVVHEAQHAMDHFNGVTGLLAKQGYSFGAINLILELRAVRRAASWTTRRGYDSVYTPLARYSNRQLLSEVYEVYRNAKEYNIRYLDLLLAAKYLPGE